MEEKYYDYINVLAFQCLYQYENKKDISVGKLTEFRDRATNIMGDVIAVDKNKELREVSSFVSRYSSYFEISGDIVKLKSNISYKELVSLAKMIKDRDDIEDDIDSIKADFNLLAVLGIYTMREALLDYMKYEKDLERKYQDLFTEKDNKVLRNEIAKLLRLRAMFFMQVHMLPGYSAASLVRTMTDLVEVDEYVMNPLNMDLYMRSDFYVEEDDSLIDMESMLYGTYQYSIFGDARYKLFTLKLLDEISKIYFVNKIDDDVDEELSDAFEDISFNERKDSIEERLFYLTYLKKLGTFIGKYGYRKDLGMVYKRLLYSLDNISDKLYLDGNVDKAIDKIGDIEINEDSFVGLHDEMVFMASEIFEVGANKYTLRKLLMLATFYDITKCEDIVDVIDGYKNNSNYPYFCDIIFGDSNNKGYGRKYEL